jgi:hypothetical protein
MDAVSGFPEIDSHGHLQMNTVLKSILIVLVVSFIGTRGIMFLVDEKLALNPTNAEVDTDARSVRMQAEQEADRLAEAIAAGADPTEVSAPTAAGQPNPAPCRTGRIEMPENSYGLDGDIYIARTIGDKTYIQVSPLTPTFLVQQDFQMVTASRLSRFPDDVTPKIREVFMMIEHCDVAPLHLASVLPPQ